MSANRTSEPAKVTGFTLIELLFAIGILGIGLVMACALFPVAIRETRDSVNDTLGTLIGENGVALAQVALTHGGKVGDVNGIGPSLRLCNSPGLDRLRAADRQYPQQGKEVFVLVRQFRQDENDYQVVAVAVSTSERCTTVLSEIDGNIADDDDGQSSTLTVSPGDSDKLAIGSPVIISANGLWAKIVAVSGSTAFLNHKLPAGSAKAWVVYEVDEKGAIAALSPAMAAFVSRTALRVTP